MKYEGTFGARRFTASSSDNAQRTKVVVISVTLVTMDKPQSMLCLDGNPVEEVKLWDGESARLVGRERTACPAR
jgi:hypothetical protein